MVEPLYVFARDATAWRKIHKNLSAAPRIVLLLDFDGTLAPIRKVPARAVLSRAVRQLLQRLTSRSHISLGIVTGRSLPEIRARVRIRNIFWIANHGLEAQVGHRNWVHPRARRIVSVLDKVFSKLKSSLATFPNAFIEHN